MRKKITLATFRRIAQAEEVMIRAMMPRCSASSPTLGVPHFARQAAAARRVFRATPRLMASLQQISSSH